MKTGWSDKEKYGSVPKKVLLIFASMGMILGGIWLIGCLRSALYSQGNIEFHGLPIASHMVVTPSESVMIDDKSSYAENTELALYQYTRYIYDDNMLIARADYDEDGHLFQWNTWEYDTAGNMRREQTENEADGILVYNHFYEYDSSGRVVHEEIYQNEDLMENTYFRYTNKGCAGVSYSYLNEQIEGGISEYCSSYTEFLEDEDGNPLCIFTLNSLYSERPTYVWKMQWMQQGNRIVNRVQNYKDNFERPVADQSSHRNYWYQFLKRADAEQLNLYEYNPKTGGQNQTLQLNYEWQSEQAAFCLIPSFYQAQYDQDKLLWQMRYEDGALAYYSVCQYDDDGRWKTAVEYEGEGIEPYTLLYRYEYPEKDMIEEYIYLIQSREFSHSFGNGENVLLTFSDTGTLCAIEMTDTVGNIVEKYEFSEADKNAGKLERVYIDQEGITGEAALLEKLEEEAALYGFQVGEDLANYVKEGAE